VTPPTISLPEPFQMSGKRLAVIALIFFCASFLWFTRNNTFPARYHPDEPAKAQQLLDREYNFHHPMLLLTATDTLSTFLGPAATPQLLVERGRWVSAGFAATAVAAIAVLAGLLAGTRAAVLAGTLGLSSSQLYELSHYMKEDTAVAMGIAAVFLAIAVHERFRSLPAAAALGFAVGLAISGKAVGVLVLPFAAWALASRRSWKQGGVAVIALLATLVLLNLPIFQHWSELVSGMSREADFAVHGHKGMTRSVPHGVYFAVLREATNPILWILLAGAYLLVLWRFRVASTALRLLAAFPVIFTLVLSFSPKTHHRYFLPITLLVFALCAIGAEIAARMIRNPKHAAWTFACISLLAVGLQIRALATTASAFGHDNRTALVEFVQKNVPPDATILQDKRVSLGDASQGKLTQQFVGKLFAADFAPYEELSQKGVRYVAVSEGDYGRFFQERLRPRDEARDAYERRRRFYETLFSSGRLLWQCPPGDLSYLQPELRLYEIPTPSVTPP